MITVTAHAIDRYIERVEPVDRETAYAIIAGAERTIEAAARFGATVVRLPNRAKLLLDVARVRLPGGQVAYHARVVTVLSRGRIANSDVSIAELPRLRAWHRHRGCRWAREWPEAAL